MLKKPLLILLGLCLFTAPSWADVDSRIVLGLYNSADPGVAESGDTLIHRAAEMPLNHLGLVVRYWDLARGLPPAEITDDTRGTIAWFQEITLEQTLALASWAKEQTAAGKRLVLLANIAPDSTSSPHPDDCVAAVYESIGLSYHGRFPVRENTLTIRKRNREMVDFETPFQPVTLHTYLQVNSESPGNKVYLKIGNPIRPEGFTAAVVTTPNGGFAHDGCVLKTDPSTRQLRWVINPFLFFEKALGVASLPRFDTTTLFGRRILFAHIDSAGWRDPSTAPNHRRSSEAVRSDIIEAFELPTSVSFTACDLDPTRLGTPESLLAAKELIALPNVELASQGMTGPLDWDRRITTRALPGYSLPISGQAKPHLAQIAVDNSRFFQIETIDAAEFLTKSVAPDGKPVGLQQWCGRCLPPAEVLSLLSSHGIANLNGGNSRFDSFHPSYTGVAPLARQVGKWRQIYAPNADDITYTNGFTTPLYGYQYVLETCRQTEYPTLIRAKARRVTPINLHHHFSSGRYGQSLQALRQVYGWAIAQKTIPIYPSHYCDIVNGFYDGQITSLDGGWEFSQYGACSTVRFDDTSLVPDLVRSEGVVGYNNWEGNLYVHLKEGGPARIYLQTADDKEPHFAESSAVVERVEVSPFEITFVTRGYGLGYYQFESLPLGSVWQISATGLDDLGRETAFSGLEAKTNARGTLGIRMPNRGLIRVRAVRVG